MLPSRMHLLLTTRSASSTSSSANMAWMSSFSKVVEKENSSLREMIDSASAKRL